MGSSPVIGTGVYAVEFSLRAECTKHLKEGYKESNRLFSLRREKLPLLWRWFNVKTNTRDVSRFDPLIHVNGDNQPKVVTNCRYGIKVLHLASNQKNSDRSRISAQSSE